MVFLSKFLEKQIRERPNLRNVKSGRNYRLIAIFSIGFLVAICPIYIYPLYNTRSYKAIQKEARAGINQEEIQPGGMRVWSDPFAPKPSEKD